MIDNLLLLTSRKKSWRNILLLSPQTKGQKLVVLGAAVKMVLGTPTSHIRVPGFESRVGS